MSALPRARLLGRAVKLAVHLLRGAATTGTYRVRWGAHWYMSGRGSARIHRWMGELCDIIGLEVRVQGTPVAGPALLVANHISWMDVIALAATARTGFVAKAEVARWPLIGVLARSAGTLFIERARSGELNATLEAMLNTLAAGRRIALFPEGTTSTGATVLPFRAALFEAARRGGAVVQPVALRYGEQATPDPLAPFVGDDSLLAHLRRTLPRRRTVLHVHFLAPMPATVGRRVLADRSLAAIRAALAPAGARLAA